MAVETGISPTELLALEPRMLWTMERYMIHRNQQMEQQRRGRPHR